MVLADQGELFLDQFGHVRVRDAVPWPFRFGGFHLREGARLAVDHEAFVSRLPPVLDLLGIPVVA